MLKRNGFLNIGIIPFFLHAIVHISRYPTLHLKCFLICREFHSVCFIKINDQVYHRFDYERRDTRNRQDRLLILPFLKLNIIHIWFL